MYLCLSVLLLTNIDDFKSKMWNSECWNSLHCQRDPAVDHEQLGRDLKTYHSVCWTFEALAR